MRSTVTMILVALLVVATTVAAGEQVFVHTGDGDVEKVRLDELADGETRTFGEGDNQVTATRTGDRIEIRFSRGPEGEVERLDCKVGAGMCNVLISDDDGARVFVVGDDSDIVEARAHASAIGWVGKPEGQKVIKVVELSGSPGVSTYECPEGDTTMRLDKDDSGPYFCPKHGLELEKSKAIGIGHEVRVLVDTEEIR